MEAIVDGAGIFYLTVGAEDGYPLFALHGGPGLDHTELHPWMDELSDTFRLIYVDLRGQGRSVRVAPGTLTLSRFAQDITLLAEHLGLERYAVFGHSFGSFVALTHAVEQQRATHYIISGGSASFSKTLPEIEANLQTFEPIELREQVRRSWAMEPTVATQEDCATLMRLQMPFHFASAQSAAYRRFTAEEHTIYAPEVLAYFAQNDYPIELEEALPRVQRPTLVLTGAQDRTCTPRASRDIAAGIAGSELVIVPEAGHMTYVEQPEIVFGAIRAFFAKHP